jgi:WhiB family redox-sensing transcriptional regulator
MARVRQLDAQHATERAHKRTPRVGAQVADHHIFRASSDEFQIAATERWEAALKIADRAASGHPCELDPAAGITECLHPDHEQDAEWAAVALDILGLPGDDLLPVEEPEFEPEPEQKKPRLSRTAFKTPDWTWQDSAECRGENLALFFGPDGERQPERELREEIAKEICGWCPVRTQCLDYAVSRPEKYGVYGGMNEDERASERRRRMRRAA